MDFDSYDYSQPTYEPPKKQSYKGLIALCVVISLLSGLLGAFCVTALSPDEPKQTAFLQSERTQTAIESITVHHDKLLSPAQVYAAYVNATVGITTSVTTNFWGYQSTSAASGSGFILSADGYILTNYHVIENSTTITVSTYGGDEYPATLIGYDNRNDIAVLKIDAKDLQPVVLGDSDKLYVGDTVLAIGNPLGELTFSLTSGTVSALDRDITMSGGNTMTLIQTDCAINSGNSGGALFNLYGEVVGITNAKYSGSSGSGATIDNIGFAIPLNDVMPIMKSIIEKGYISRPYVGISVADVSREAQSYGLPAGAAIRLVNEDSPALKGGLQVGDIVTHVNGDPISGSSELVSLIGQSQPEQTLTMTVFRKGQTIELTVTVGEQIQSATEKSQR